MSDDAATKTSGASFGPMLIAIAAFFLYFSKDFPASGLDVSDPGPRGWPMFLAGCLLAAGIGYTTAWLVRALLGRLDADAARRRKPVHEYVTDWGVQNVVLILIGLVLLITALPYLGFALSATLFSTIILTRLGHPGVAAALRKREQAAPSLWLELVTTAAIAFAISVILVVLIILLFDRVFDSPLPRGETLGLPF